MAKTIYFTDNFSRTAKQGPDQCSTARLCPDGRRNPEIRVFDWETHYDARMPIAAVGTANYIGRIFSSLGIITEQ